MKVFYLLFTEHSLENEQGALDIWVSRKYWKVLEMNRN